MCIKPLSPYRRLLVYCLEGSRFTSFPSQFIPKVKYSSALMSISVPVQLARKSIWYLLTYLCARMGGKSALEIGRKVCLVLTKDLNLQEK